MTGTPADLARRLRAHATADAVFDSIGDGSLNALAEAAQRKHDLYRAAELLEDGLHWEANHDRQVEIKQRLERVWQEARRFIKGLETEESRKLLEWSDSVLRPGRRRA